MSRWLMFLLIVFSAVFYALPVFGNTVPLFNESVSIPEFSDIELYNEQNPSFYLQHGGQVYDWCYAHSFEFAPHQMVVSFSQAYRMLQFAYYAKSNNAELRVIDDDTGIVIRYFQADTNHAVQNIMVNIEGVQRLRFEFIGESVVAVPMLDTIQGTISHSRLTIAQIMEQPDNLLHYINEIDDRHLATIDSGLLFQNDILGYGYGITGGDYLQTVSTFTLPANKFKFLTFETFCPDRYGFTENATIEVIDRGNHNAVLGSITIQDNEYPKRLTVNIEGVTELGIRLPRESFAVVAKPQLSETDFSGLDHSVFTEEVYSIEVVRDFDQQETIELYNGTERALDLQLRVANQPQEIPIDFIGLGNSQTQIFSLAPGERRVVTLAIHAQRAKEEEYTFFLQALDANSGSPLGGAVVELNVNHQNIDFILEETGFHPGSLVKTMKLTNKGDTISDFIVILDDTLKGKVSVNPNFNDLRLTKNQTFEFKVSPRLSADDMPITGSITVRGAGLRKSESLTFAVPGTYDIYNISFDDILPDIIADREGPEWTVKHFESPTELETEGIFKLEIQDEKTDMAFAYQATVTTVNDVPDDKLDEVAMEVSFPSPESIRVDLTYYVVRENTTAAKARKEEKSYTVVDEIQFQINAYSPYHGPKSFFEGYLKDLSDINNAGNAMLDGRITAAQFAGYGVWKCAKVGAGYLTLLPGLSPGAAQVVNRLSQFMGLVDGRLQDMMGIGDGSATAAIESFMDAVSNSCINQGEIPMEMSLTPSGSLADTLGDAIAMMRFEQIGSTPVTEDVDLSINDQEVWQESEFEPENNIIYPEVPVDHLNIPGSNTMTFRNVSHDNTGYYTALVERRLYIPLSNLKIPVVAASQEDAKSQAPEVFRMGDVRLSEPDFAVFESGIKVASGDPRMGRLEQINLTVHNMGSAHGLVNVKVTDFQQLDYRANVLVKAFDKIVLDIPWQPTASGINSLVVTLNQGRNGEIVGYGEHYTHNNRVTKSIVVKAGSTPSDGDDDIDDDGDDVLDTWERDNYGHIDFDRTDYNHMDTDGDGYSDLEEYLYGTGVYVKDSSPDRYLMLMGDVSYVLGDGISDVYGGSDPSHIVVENGARVRCFDYSGHITLNWPESASVNVSLLDTSDSRVMFESTQPYSRLIVSAGTVPKTINFSDGAVLLYKDQGIVTLGDQVVYTEPATVTTALDALPELSEHPSGSLETPDAYLVMDTPISYTLKAGSSTSIYGSASFSNTLNFESGASAQLYNFSNDSTISIEAESIDFHVYRSGTLVIFEGSDGTLLKLPATQVPQTIQFVDKTLELIVESGAVRLGAQVLELSPTGIE